MADNIMSIFRSENLVDFHPLQSGHEYCTPGHSFGPARRNHFLFHYIINGKGTLQANDSSGATQTYRIHAGEGFMIFPGQINTYFADEGHPWEYTWIEFDGIRAQELVELAGLSMNRPIYHSDSPKKRDEMKQAILTLADDKYASPLLATAHLYVFLDCFASSCSSRNTLREGASQNSSIQGAISFIESNYASDISVESVADHVNLNRSYFGKLFKNSTGLSPQKFLIRYRMTKATELLRLTTRPIGEVSIAVGYQDQLHFSRAFKATYGMSPREWRRKNMIAMPMN